MTHMSGRVQKRFQLSLLVLFLATPCAAQETPLWEFFGGYSVAKSDVRAYYKSTPIIYAFRSQSVTLRGWDVSVTENLGRRVGGTLDISGDYKTVRLLGTPSQQRMHSILYGPRLFYRTRWLTPFAHVLIGAAHAQVKVTPVGPHESDFSFAMAAGGGLDVNLGKWAAVRLIKAEYFRANVLSIKQNSFRASAGMVFNLGRRK
jgi:hypothetical protein